MSNMSDYEQILANISKYEQRARISAKTSNMNTYEQYAQILVIGIDMSKYQ